MHQLAGRLTALDPDAGEALRVIPYFDELLYQRAGLESMVRGAAVLSGATTRLVTPGRRVALRVLPDGHREDVESDPDPQWQSQSLVEPPITMWLERPGPSGPVDAMVLERATEAVRTVLERTRGRYAQQKADNGELVELLLDEGAPGLARAHASRALGFRPGQAVRVVAELGMPLRVCDAHEGGRVDPTGARTGVGPLVAIEDVAPTGPLATTSLRLTAEGTPSQPGPRVVFSDDLGAAILLAMAFDHNPGWARHPDLLAIDEGSRQVAWLLSTLAAVADGESLRAAAATLVTHHSTLQKRLAQVERLLGWDITSPAGKFRLQVALILRRLELSRTQD